MTSAPLIAASAVAGLVVLERARGGAIGSPTPGVSETASSGAHAAMRALQAASPITGGVRFDVGTSGKALDGLLAMRRALVSSRGFLDPENPDQRYPAGLTVADCRQILDAWLRAWRAAAEANLTSANDYKLSACEGGHVLTNAIYSTADKGYAWTMPVAAPGVCADAKKGAGSTNHNDWHLSPLGHAVCSLLFWRRELHTLGDVAGGMAASIATQETFDRLVRLAVEMDAVGATFPGHSPTELESFNWSDVPGALGHAGGAVAEFLVEDVGGGIAGAVGGVLGDVAGGLVGGIVKSPLFWAGVLGFIAWRTYK